MDTTQFSYAARNTTFERTEIQTKSVIPREESPEKAKHTWKKFQDRAMWLLSNVAGLADNDKGTVKSR